VVSEDRKLVVDQREERRNATEAISPAHQRLRAGTNHTPTPPDGREEVMSMNFRIVGSPNGGIYPNGRAGFHSAIRKSNNSSIL
jgi:hypothetical protein